LFNPSFVAFFIKKNNLSTNQKFHNQA